MDSKNTRLGDIQAAIDAGKVAVQKNPINHPNGDTTIFVPEGFKTETIKALNLTLPDQVSRSEELIEQKSFTDYIDRFKTASTVVLAKPGSGSMEAVLDYHGQSGGERAKPDHCAHVVRLKTEFDENWKRWRDIDRRQISQEEFAYFIEEMLHTIGSPDGADLLDMAQTLKVNRGVVFKSNSRLKDGTVDIEYSEQDATTSAVKGTVSVPDEITIVAPLYLMRETQSVKAKLRYRVGKGDPLSFRIDILNRKLIEFDAFKKMADEIGQVTGCPVYLSA